MICRGFANRTQENTNNKINGQFLRIIHPLTFPIFPKCNNNAHTKNIVPQEALIYKQKAVTPPQIASIVSDLHELEPRFQFYYPYTKHHPQAPYVNKPPQESIKFPPPPPPSLSSRPTSRDDKWGVKKSKQREKFTKIRTKDAWQDQK